MGMLTTPQGAFTYPDGEEAADVSLWIGHALTQVEGTIDLLKPSVRVGKTNAQSLPAGDSTALLFNSTEWDDLDMHDPAVNPSRLIAPIAGEYVVNGQIAYATNTNGVRQATIRANGATLVAVTSSQPVTGLPTRLNLTGSVRLPAGGYVELLGFHNSSTNPLSVQTTVGETWFSMRWERG